MHISQNDRLFILKALKEDIRIDGRNPFDSRKVTVTLGLHNASATVSMGSTRVTTTIVPVLDAPFPDRPNEGTLRFNAEYSPMASSEFEGGRHSEAGMEMIRLLEQVLRNSRAVDREALCVLAGQKVWHLDVNVTVLDHAGNLTDACLLSAVAALMVFRRPEVEINTSNSGSGVARTLVLSPAVREPLPLSLHQLPLSTTFALFGAGESIVIDPTSREEAAASGVVTIIVNTNSDICAIRKASGVGIPLAQVQRLMHLASNRASEMMQDLKEVLQQHEASRVSSRVRRHASAPQQLGATSRSVNMLPPNDISATVQPYQLQEQDSGSGEETSSGEDDMSVGNPVRMIASSAEGVPISSHAQEAQYQEAALQHILTGGRSQRKAAPVDRPVASKKTAIGLQKEPQIDLDFLEGDTDPEKDVLDMRKALQTKNKQWQA
ncbi:g10917 [Coccomyxa viridis]|uniref:G10917 protein n=1 Tax=Coccomyxa viridis TaxID=1274662 RepID=A0ABP1G6Y2_9CHLO